MKDMHYWRKDSFEILRTLQDRLGTVPELQDYCSYLSLLEQGRRKEALGLLPPLIAGLRSLGIERQRELAGLLCREAEQSPGHKLIPHPLQAEFIDPVIREWLASDPDAAEPHRWTGELEDLVRAVELDSSCDLTRWRMILRILNLVGYSTHELPHGYLGDIESDEDLLILAGREAAKLAEEEKRERCLEAIQSEWEAIQAYRMSG